MANSVDPDQTAPIGAVSMANSVDPDQTAPIGAVCSGSTLFASILNSLVLFAIICSRRYFQMHIFSWRFKG